MNIIGPTWTPARRVRQPALLALALFLSFALSPAVAHGHGGGTPRITNQAIGPYRLYAWTEPEPMRVGEAHLTIAVTQVADKRAQPGQVETPVTDADVVVTFTPADALGQEIEVRADTTSSLGDVYYEADTLLPSAGEWVISIAVEGREGGGQGGFDVNVEAAHRLNWTLVGIGGILFVTALAFVAMRAGRRESQPAPPRRSRRSARAGLAASSLTDR